MMNAEINPDDDVRRVFQDRVPAVASGTVELVSISRDPGKEVLVAVRSHDPSVDAVSACVGKGGIRPKSIVRDLGGDHLRIILWNPSLESFILNALSGFHTPGSPPRVGRPKVVLDEAARTAAVSIDPDSLACLSEQLASYLRLASQLVGCEIQLVHD